MSRSVSFGAGSRTRAKEVSVCLQYKKAASGFDLAGGFVLGQIKMIYETTVVGSRRPCHTLSGLGPIVSTGSQRYWQASRTL